MDIKMEHDERTSTTKQKEKIAYDSLGYYLTEITVKKLTKESYHSKFAVKVNFRSLQNYLADGCRVFGLRKAGFLRNGPIEVLFVVHISDNSYDCRSVTFAASIDESEQEAITKYLHLEVARLALSADCHNNFFLGEALPELQKEAGPVSIGLWASLFIMWFFAFRGIFDSTLIGVLLGFFLSFCLSHILRPVRYYMPDTTLS